MLPAEPPAISHRLPFRPGYQKSVELGIDLTARRGQVMQGKIIEEQTHLLERPPHDGRSAQAFPAILSATAWATSMPSIAAERIPPA